MGSQEADFHRGAIEGDQSGDEEEDDAKRKEVLRDVLVYQDDPNRACFYWYKCAPYNQRI